VRARMHAMLSQLDGNKALVKGARALQSTQTTWNLEKVYKLYIVVARQQTPSEQRFSLVSPFSSRALSSSCFPFPILSVAL
jgi:hypothetical protein